MTKQKTLGQLAWESFTQGTSHAPWHEQAPQTRAMWENMANGIAREVERRVREERNDEKESD